MNDKGKLSPILTFLLMIRRMVVIDLDQGFLLVSLSHMMRASIMSAKAKIHLPKA